MPYVGDIGVADAGTVYVSCSGAGVRKFQYTGQYVGTFGAPCVALAVSPDAALTLRTHRPGDRFQPPGLGGHRQKLSDLWINAHVPADWRSRLPLLLIGDAIAWVGMGPQGRVAEAFLVTPGTESTLVIRWETPKQTISAAAYGN